uniref:Uncharacterized protein n=1 Tax=viral metagenome TaxID=1070528 RepID=A0A6C0BK26_9ZZZZ
MLQIKQDMWQGFFSCCSTRLEKIIEFFNLNKQEPEEVDSSDQFKWYKPMYSTADITYQYFEKQNNHTINYKEIRFTNGYQYLNYHSLPYLDYVPFIRKYFYPSVEVKQLIKDIEEKYKIDYPNTCVLFYRGNDKATEVTLPSYESLLEAAKQIKQQNPNVRFLVQSDETEFLQKMLELPNSFYFHDEIRHIPRQKATVDHFDINQNLRFSKLFLAITIIMSKSQYIVCNTGNCSMWICLYRGHTQNVFQIT